LFRHPLLHKQLVQTPAFETGLDLFLLASEAYPSGVFLLQFSPEVYIVARARLNWITMSAEILALMAIAQMVKIGTWDEKKKKGHGLLRAGMSGKQAKVCKPYGITFDENGSVTAMDVSFAGLTGKL
jgi:hypothetical protein